MIIKCAVEGCNKSYRQVDEGDHFKRIVEVNDGTCILDHEHNLWEIEVEHDNQT